MVFFTLTKISTGYIPVGRLLVPISQVILSKENYEDLSGDLLPIRFFAHFPR